MSDSGEEENRNEETVAEEAEDVDVDEFPAEVCTHVEMQYLHEKVEVAPEAEIKLADGSYLMTFSVGELSGDGHDKKDYYAVKSSLSPNDFLKAFRQGVARLGYNITAFCQDYEDNRIPDNFISALEAAGFQPEETPGYENEYPDCLNPCLFKEILLFTVKQGEPEFTWSEVEMPLFHIGGYGLYFN